MKLKFAIVTVLSACLLIPCLCFSYGGNGGSADLQQSAFEAGIKYHRALEKNHDKNILKYIDVVYMADPKRKYKNVQDPSLGVEPWREKAVKPLTRKAADYLSEIITSRSIGVYSSKETADAIIVGEAVGLYTYDQVERFLDALYNRQRSLITRGIPAQLLIESVILLATDAKSSSREDHTMKVSVCGNFLWKMAIMMCGGTKEKD